MKKIRGIIAGLNIAVSVLLTLDIANAVFGDVTGWRLILLAIGGFVAIYSALVAIENTIIKKGRRNETNGQGKGGRGSVPGVPWHANRFSMDQQKNRDSGQDIKKVQADAGKHYSGTAYYFGKGV